MKKKFLAFLFAVCLIIPCGIMLTACGGDGDKSDDHKHTMVTISAKAATCTEDGNVEYYRCDGCGKTFSDANGNTPITNISIPALGHIGGNANCLQSAVCERCDNTYGGLGEHDFGEFTQTKAPTCTEKGENTAVCSVCQETKTEQIPALGHSGEWKVVAEPRCFDDGEKQRICTVCDALEEEKIASFNSHDLQDSTCVSGKECTRCNYVEGAARGHAFGEWMITTEPDCTENGEKERSCLVCGEKETSVVYKTGHSYDDWSVITEPTCTENGEKESYCSECNHHTTSTIYKKGHSGEWVETKAPTCTINGEQKRTCEECGEIESKVIYAGHDYSSWEVTLEATCTTKGEKERSCQQCGHIVTSEISMTAHTYDWVVTQEASCTENGVKVGTCSECGQEVNGTINKLGHNMQGGTCTTPSICSRCDFVEYNDHLLGERYEIISPDCERHGIEHAKCEVCGYIEEYQTTPLGHNYGAFEIRKEPTCTEFGRERRICTVCEKAQDRQVDMLPHNAGEWIIVEEATCTTEGLQKKTCLDCGSFVTDEVIPALGHDFLDATCLEPKICKTCSFREGEPIDHQLGEYECELCEFMFRYSDGSEIFTYTLSDDGNSYWISGLTRSSLPSKTLTPNTYNGKPVIGISELNISSYGGNFDIYLSNSIEFIAENAFKNTKVERVFIGKNSKMKTIGNYAFAESYYLTSVNIPESVTSIGEYAFYGCSRLTTINIPNSVTSIGRRAFYWCSGLTSINIPESVTGIGEGVFSSCRSLTSINIPNSVTSIGEEAFSDCRSLKSITIPESVTNIGEYAFSSCGSLMTINIPNSVTSIGSSAFAYCSSLKSINIPESVTSIGEEAFYGCAFDSVKCNIAGEGFTLVDGTLNITTMHTSTSGVPAWSNVAELVLAVNFDNAGSFDTIGSSAFANCTNLTSINIPKGVISIGDSAFADCAALTNITIPEGVISIGSGAFSGCTALTNITIPEGVTSIGDDAFYGCSSLTSVNIPDSVTSIGEHAFCWCSSLTSINIPASVTSIGEGVFSRCSALTSINIPNSITSIGDSAFYGCSSLTSIDIPESVTSIGEEAFYGCSSLTSINIAESVTSIGEEAFYGCAFDSVKCNIAGEGFTLVDGTLNITTMHTSSSGVPVWRNVAQLVLAVNFDNAGNFDTIGTSAFAYCSSLKSINIPESVVSIGAEVFYGCTFDSVKCNITGEGYTLVDGTLNITTMHTASYGKPVWSNVAQLVLAVNFDNAGSFKTIGSYAFDNCSSLRSINIPEGVTSIGEFAFFDCRSLKSIIIPESVTSVGDQAFYGCTFDSVKCNISGKGYTLVDGTLNITTMHTSTFGDPAWSKVARLVLAVNFDNAGSFKTIGIYAFENCSSLTSINIPESVTSIESSAFYGCSSLTSINIPESVTSIESRAFDYCSGLTDVYYSGTEEQWSAIDINDSGNSYLTSATIHYNYTGE